MERVRETRCTIFKMQLQNSEFTGPFQQYIASAAPFDVDVNEVTMMLY